MSKITKNQFPKKLTIFAKIDFCKTFVHVSHSQRSVAYDNNLDYYVLFISIVDLEKKTSFGKMSKKKIWRLVFRVFALIPVLFVSILSLFLPVVTVRCSIERTHQDLFIFSKLLTMRKTLCTLLTITATCLRAITKSFNNCQF